MSQSAKVVLHTDQVEGYEKFPADERKTRREGYIEIPTTLFIQRFDVGAQALPNVALFLFSEDDSISQIKGQDQPFSPLALSPYPAVWIKESDFPLVRKLAESVLTNPKITSSLPQEKKVEALQRAAAVVVDDIFIHPTPENITRGVKVVSSFVHTLIKDPKAYFVLSKLSAHDSYTLQHSIGASVNSIMLARKVGITAEADLLEVGLAGLLHDIGKVSVRPEVINKPGPLDDEEWKEMREHAGKGFELVKDHPLLSERTKGAILEHHEDVDGKGYPTGRKLYETHLFSRIVGICDIFNALTTNRSYSNARSPFDAFQLMREKLSHKFDAKLFQELILIYGGKID